jgi:FkbM family methyltransferase
MSPSTETEILTWQPYWRAALRAIKRATLGRHRITLVDRDYIVAYESRGHLEEEDHALLAELARGSKCVFDVGANVGLTALAMSGAIAKDGVVWAFDAAESVSLILRENILLNHLSTKIRVVNAPLTSTDGALISFYWNFDAGNSSSVIEPADGIKIPLMKSGLSLDRFIEQTGAIPEFVKIDVEGAEADVLVGMTHALGAYRPRVFVEIHSGPTTLSANVARILGLLRPLRYRLVHLASGRTVEDAAFFSMAAKHARTFTLLVPAEDQRLVPVLSHREEAITV